MFRFVRKTDTPPRCCLPWALASALAIASLALSPALAQAGPRQGSTQQAGADAGQEQPTRPSPGRLAESEVGEVGRRQTRDQEIANIKPAARINNRIANRVQSRIRNRIDRNYDPQANATSPFSVADAESRDTRQDPRR